MSTINTSPQFPAENPRVELRKQILALKSQFEGMGRASSADMRKLDSVLTSIPTMTAETTKSILQIIESLQESGDPAQILVALDSYGKAAKNGEKPTMPAGFKGQEIFSKVTNFMEQLQKQFASVGFSTLKFLAGLFGSESLFGRIFLSLKNSEQVQVSYVVQTLGDRLQGETPEEKAAEATKFVKESQSIIDAVNEELADSGKKQTFDIEDLLKKVLGDEGIKGKSSLEAEDMVASAEKLGKAEVEKLAQKRQERDARNRVASAAPSPSAQSAPPAAAPPAAPSTPPAPSATPTPPEAPPAAAA